MVAVTAQRAPDGLIDRSGALGGAGEAIGWHRRAWCQRLAPADFVAEVRRNVNEAAGRADGGSGLQEMAGGLNLPTSTGWPIISLLDVPPIPGAVVRPFTDPIPLYPWTMVHRRSLKQPALAALDQAIDEIAAAEGWWDMPESGWLASADREVLAELRP